MGERFLYFFELFYHSSKLNLTGVRKSPTNKVVVGLLSFLIVWILDTNNMALLNSHSGYVKIDMCPLQFLCHMTSDILIFVVVQKLYSMKQKNFDY